MNIGLGIGDYSGPPVGPEDLARQAGRAEEAGFGSVWLPQVMGSDALTTLVVAGASTTRINLCTAVVPIQLRHPIALAQQALTVQAAVKGRLHLGIGLSHRPVIETMWGIPFEKPAKQMDEYVTVLSALIEKGSVSFAGEFYKLNASLSVPGASPFPILLAALGKRMLRIAGRKASGTVTWMTGRKTVESHIVPIITDAANDAGRPAPRIVVGLPVALTADVEAARNRAAAVLAVYPTLPSYRAMLDIEGAKDAGDIVVAGDEAAIEAQLRSYFDAGATEILAVPLSVGETKEEKIASVDRTIEYLGTLARSH